MAVPRSMGWLVVTGAVVLALVGLSFLALDRPNVVWSEGRAFCPQCRTPVPAYAHRCPQCREEFDWVASPEEDSPWCDSCLSTGEDSALQERRVALGEETATKRVATVLHVDAEAAKAYLRDVRRGRCGWCGGTGRDLSAPNGEHALCPVCFGEKACIACDGDERVKLGLEAAGREIVRYQERLELLRSPYTTPAFARKEVAQADREFLRRYTGTREASDLAFWPSFRSTEEEPVPAPMAETAAARARGRLKSVLDALRQP